MAPALEIKPAAAEVALWKNRNPPALLDAESSQFHEGIFAVDAIAVGGRNHDALRRRASVEPVKEPMVGVDEMLEQVGEAQQVCSRPPPPVLRLHLPKTSQR